MKRTCKFARLYTKLKEKNSKKRLRNKKMKRSVKIVRSKMTVRIMKIKKRKIKKMKMIH